MLIDTHAHLNFKTFKKDYKEAIKRAFDGGVLGTIIVGSSLKDSKKAIDIAKEYEQGVYAAAGIHPTNAGRTGEPFQIEELRKLAQNPKVVALGETGLDLFHHKEAKEQQMHLFKEMINLARELNLPLVVHCREAFRDLLEILQSVGCSRYALRGVIHCFSGTLQQAKRILDLGLHISFTGNITYAGTDKLREAVREIPLEKMMVETDSPFLAPEPYRGKRNEPSNVIEVAKKIAQIKEISLEKVAEITTQNAQTLFQI